ncbi:outer membrane receptor for ferric coprogen and ferric-rhodotorulic acid [Roseateles sp. DAIF2]|uniref:putative porin n=1 Tax=Roseateles sp. DAIF2 TaxID=2714952 RepID=UPI0018A32248|nr:putative porin [Roseateles sp. DAIF2]QPF73064.1 outer membrane receptor for ferric coprogen and ferric-rhodotorulic acid [Roseateles sp. DAIF2]
MKLNILTTALAAAALIAQPAQAQSAVDEKQELAQLRATTLALIEALVGQGLLSRERADTIVRQAQQAGAQAAAPAVAGGTPAPKVVRVPYVPETVRQQLREEIKTEVLAQARSERWGEPGALPEWLGRISIEGDVRVRSQTEMLDDGNVPAHVFRSQTESPAWAPDLSNTTQNRDRLTLRARLGVNALLTEQVSAGLRLSTGTTSGPTSSSQTLGTSFNKASLVLDRAWLRWNAALGWRPLSLEAGRMANPFYSTDLAWADDLSFDGAALKLNHETAGRQRYFATAGAFPLEELSQSGRDKWLLGAQLGAELPLAEGVSAKLGLAAYEFRHVAGVRENEPPPTGPLAGTKPYQSSQYPSSLRLKGNTLINLNDPTSAAAPTWGLASRFRPVNLTGSVSFSQLAPVLVDLSLDWIKNTGFDLADIRARAQAGTALDNLREMTTAWQGRIGLGRRALERRGDWQAYMAYRKVERDAWIDGFTDTTWHLGGTNYKGWSLGGSYALDKRFALGLRWTSTRNLDDGLRFLAVPGDPSSLSGTLSSAPMRIDVFQLDLSGRF